MRLTCCPFKHVPMTPLEIFLSCLLTSLCVAVCIHVEFKKMNTKPLFEIRTQNEFSEDILQRLEKLLPDYHVLCIHDMYADEDPLIRIHNVQDLTIKKAKAIEEMIREHLKTK